MKRGKKVRADSEEAMLLKVGASPAELTRFYELRGIPFRPWNSTEEQRRKRRALKILGAPPELIMLIRIPREKK